MVKLNSLKRYRYKHDISQKELAKMLNVSDSSYSLYENNKREMPYKTLIKFLEIRDESQDKAFISILKEFLRQDD